MSYQKITSAINSLTGKANPRSPLYPNSQNIMEFGVLTTRKASELLNKFEIKMGIFSGKPRIIMQIGKEQLPYPVDIDISESQSDQGLLLEKYISKLLINENFSIKLEVPGYGGIFKWLPKDELLLLITIYKLDARRFRQKKQPLSPYTLKCRSVDRNDSSIQPYGRQMARILYYTFLDYKRNEREQFDSSYRKFLDHYFQPFENFLYHERLAIRDPTYRPKCRFNKQIIENQNEKSGRVFLSVEDPPRQITESGNSVVPAGKGGKKQFMSARISDYDEFNSLLIFEEGYKLKDWPNEGTLLLEGDMASNRRKSNSIRKIKTQGLNSLAKLADILMRPWGLPEVISVPRSYFNQGISHDNKESKPQAQAIDIALSTDDVALIHGPPGTGKTTVIVEIIRHVISNGGRVIMCAPTHVAVDNVLERIMGLKGISAVRVGGTAYMDNELQQYRLSEKSKSFENALPSFSKTIGSDDSISEIQSDFVKGMEKKGSNFMEQLAISESNLVCGTTIGIARFEPPKDNPVDFDVMIIDETSKTTVMEFLVPAVRAKKWILVGDHRQLPPYVNEQEIRIYVQRYFKQLLNQNGEQNGEKPSKEEDITLYDDKTNDLIASLRRYHEETHALGEGMVDNHWDRILKLFEYQKKPIKSIEEMVDFALGSCFHYFLKRIDPSRNARLIVQHRMPSILSNFLDKEIYKGKLKTSKSASTHGLKLPAIENLKIGEISSPLTFLSTERIPRNEEIPGKYKGYYNSCEAVVITELIAKFIEMDPVVLGYSESSPLTIGVITYYAGQSREINKQLRRLEGIEREHGWRYKVPNKPIKIRVSIVDRFQGQEQDIVILSLTRSNKIGNIGFLKNLQRVNVSLSRAKQNLIIVGNARFFSKTKTKPPPILKQLAKYSIKEKLIIYPALEDDWE